MLRIALTIAWRLALCAGVTFVVTRLIGLVGLVVCAPLFGIALARPLLEVFGDMPWLARWLAYRRVEGRFFAYRGHWIDIVDDAADERWLRVADVRKVIKHLPANEVLQNLYPAGLQTLGPRAALRMRADTLRLYLEKATDAETLRFRNWLDRDVIFPARRGRERGLPVSRL